jgi:hypothetical protein
MTKKPKWNDLPRLTTYVEEKNARIERECLQEDLHSLMEAQPQEEVPLDEQFRRFEQKAIHAAEAGDFRWLADLIEGISRNPFGTNLPALFRAKGFRIGSRAEGLVAAFLRQARRPKRKRLTVAELRAGSPNYELAERVGAFQAILEQAYPGEQAHREKAIEIIFPRNPKAQHELLSFMRKGKHRYHHAAQRVVDEYEADIGSDPL